MNLTENEVIFTEIKNSWNDYSKMLKARESIKNQIIKIKNEIIELKDEKEMLTREL